MEGAGRIVESVGGRPISDVGGYVTDMGRSFIDKLFFVDKIDPDLIVDFGCANGLVLSKISALMPGARLVGYDLDPDMLDKAGELLGGSAELTGDWGRVAQAARGAARPMLLLSSVVHEVYSYSTPRQVRDFWSGRVFGGLFKWVCIRDMIPSGEPPPRDFSEDVARVLSMVDPFYVRSFELRWGPIGADYRTFIHFLLKYRYVDNWDREVEENYVPLSLKTLKSKIPPGYTVIYEHSYIYDFLQSQVRRDLGVEIRQTTHTKLIVERRRP